MTPAPDLPRLPAGFRFGASTAAYQIEGAVGRGRPRAAASGTRSAPSRAGSSDGSTGAVACDHYHRYPEDVALMRDLGHRRLPVLGRLAADPARGQRPRRTRTGSTSTTGWSTSCSRPASQPMATLFHWDLPQALEDARRLARSATPPSGSPSTPPWSARGSATGSRTGCPVNEPNVVTMLGYALGVHAPGQAADVRRAARSPTTCCSATAWRSRRCAATGATQRRHAPTTTRRSGRRPTPPRTSRRPRPLRRRCGTGSSPTRCCSAATPRASPS